MSKRILLLALALAVGTAAPTLAQRGGPGGPGPKDGPGRGGPGGPDQVRKLQAEIEELQAEMKKLANALHQPKDQPQRKEGPPKGGMMPSATGGSFGGSAGGPPKGNFGPGPMGGGFSGFGGFGPGGPPNKDFGPMGGGFSGWSGGGPKGGFGFGGPKDGPPKKDFGPMPRLSGGDRDRDRFGGPDNDRGGNVQRLEAQLEQLHQANKRIEEQIKATEARIREARSAGNRQDGSRPKDGPRPGNSVDQRLERIEKLLNELQAERRKR
jgi:outer membrane murein-binding lipoprotein Lpp